MYIIIFILVSVNLFLNFGKFRTSFIETCNLSGLDVGNYSFILLLFTIATNHFVFDLNCNTFSTRSPRSLHVSCMFCEIVDIEIIYFLFRVIVWFIAKSAG